MTARKRKPSVVVDIGKWTAEVRGLVRHTVPAVRQACGQLYTLEYDNRSRCIRVHASKAGDVIAALEHAGVTVTVRGEIPQPELFT